MKNLILASAVLSSSLVYAVELKRASFEAQSMVSKHDPFLPEYTAYQRPQLPYQQRGDEKWSYSICLRNDVSLWKTFAGETLWLNTVTGASTTNRFRYVGYEFRVVQQFNPNFGIFYHHHSEHGVDVARDDYPLHDGIGFQFCFGGTDCK